MIVIRQKNYEKAKEFLGENEAEVEGISFSGLIVYDEVFGLQTEQGEEDVLTTQFESAKKAFFNEDYEGAKEILEKLEKDLASVEGRYSLKGETFLLMGATYEKLKYRELAIKYYCKAKEILGEGKTIEGLELEELKYYKEACKRITGAVAGKEVKKKSALGKILGIFIFLAALGGIIWYLFFSKNAPLKKKEEKKEPGKYTSITIQIDVTYSGLNSKGRRKLWIDGNKKLDERFIYPQKADENSTCDDATKKESYSYTVTINTTTMNIKQQYINWDYHSFKSPGTNYKILCTNWSLSIVKYEYEAGKADPGTPVPTGLDQLSMDIDNDCVQKSLRVHDCTTEATITFKAPTSETEIQQVYSVTQTKIRSTH
jgi:tetratricopeptide (TPR) repeat protein